MPALLCRVAACLILTAVAFHGLPPLLAQEAEPVTTPVPTEETPDEQELPEKVTVDSADTAPDEAISERLLRILEATGWFTEAEVTVEDGVVFFEGLAESEARREWATQLARRTEDVVAVVNHMELEAHPLWDLSPARAELYEMVRTAIINLPLILVALVLLLVTVFTVGFAYRFSKPRYERNFRSRLLSDVAARATAGLILVIGVYFVLRISGLTRLAATILGGTGLVGIIFGFAFRDIAENFLASILISLQRPFRIDDLIEVDNVTGFVRNVTTRGTVLQTFNGNHVYISNSTIYKSRLTNFTSNPKTRDEFVIGIGYDDAIVKAQDTILAQLKRHPAVQDDPAPLVLVDSLGPSTVNLRIYVWIDTREFSLLKVRSALLRQIVAELTEAGISMPDEAREVIFPRGIDMRLHRREPDQATTAIEESDREKALHVEDDVDVSVAEDDLAQEKADLDRQHAEADKPEGGATLI
ncbi:mechanosensitive ion channel family protein [Rubinisphaera margarita]|uniref:mechanosensitive ion channel family protein n=1 Tax=Rubinisphaera margarita TaxID=2909586 RepID=UPI001EE87DD8|nr:mechanosensitive ion channel family protein [Rubinisphaera margarita]MCG6156444.1 mechanosensitive ion channel [Rubinisphaera margarita]